MLAGRSIGVIRPRSGRHHVARLLARAGARFVVTDLAPAARGLAEEVGARWVDPDDALTTEVDILVPAALGGLLTARTVPLLRCAAVACPANNQLDDPATARLLAAPGRAHGTTPATAASELAGQRVLMCRRAEEVWAADAQLSKSTVRVSDAA